MDAIPPALAELVDSCVSMRKVERKAPPEVLISASVSLWSTANGEMIDEKRGQAELLKREVMAQYDRYVKDLQNSIDQIKS